MAVATPAGPSAVAPAAASKATGLANLRPWPPGVSGNPSGRSTRYRKLFDVIASEVGGESGLTAMEREYISRAAEQLRRAERERDNTEHVRLTRCAALLIERVRHMRRERERRASPLRPPLAWSPLREALDMLPAKEPSKT